MKYEIIGKVKSKSFKLIVEAKSEKHAEELGIIKLGSKNKTKKPAIKIEKISKSE